MISKTKFSVFNFILFCFVTYFYFATKGRVSPYIAYRGPSGGQEIVSTPLNAYFMNAVFMIFFGFPRKDYNPKSAPLMMFITAFIAFGYISLILEHLN
jgi:hypothetical protein